MPLVEFDRVKDHLRLDALCDAFTVELYQMAAEAAVVAYLDRPVHPAGTTLPIVGAPGYNATAIVASPDIIAAVLLLLGSLYENREAGGDSAMLPPVVRALLAPYRYWRAVPCPEPEDDEDDVDAGV